MQTYSVRASEVRREWYVIDAEGQVLGRLATQIATVLRGKHKPIFSPHLDTGDHVIVINAEKVKLTGKKVEKKRYFRHTGYPGGGRWDTVRELRDSHPDRIIRKAIKGMLPKNRLGRAQIRKLKVYAGSDHPHAAQSPKALILPGDAPRMRQG